MTESIPSTTRSRIDGQQDTFELEEVQSHCRITNVAPIHMEEQIDESLENINIMELMNLPIENNEFNSIDVENPELLKNQQVPDPVVFFNNRKFNPNLISFAGLTFLFVMTTVVLIIFILHINFDGDFESVMYLMYYCLPVALPTIYFIVNPKHLITAMSNLPCNY